MGNQYPINPPRPPKQMNDPRNPYFTYVTFSPVNAGMPQIVCLVISTRLSNFAILVPESTENLSKYPGPSSSLLGLSAEVRNEAIPWYVKMSLFTSSEECRASLVYTNVSVRHSTLITFRHIHFTERRRVSKTTVWRLKMAHCEREERKHVGKYTSLIVR